MSEGFNGMQPDTLRLSGRLQRVGAPTNAEEVDGEQDSCQGEGGSGYSGRDSPRNTQKPEHFRRGIPSYEDVRKDCSDKDRRDRYG